MWVTLSDANALAKELEHLWLTSLLLRVPEAFGSHISLQLARSACRQTAFARANLRRQGQSDS